MKVSKVEYDKKVAVQRKQRSRENDENGKEKEEEISE